MVLLSITQSTVDESASHCEVGKFPTGIEDHNAVLYDDTVMVCGGRNGRQARPSCFKFDREDNSWVETTPMITRRSQFGMASIDDGVVVVGDGDPYAKNITRSRKSAEIYRNLHWKPIQDPPVGMTGHCLVPIGRHEVMAVSGDQYKTDERRQSTTSTMVSTIALVCLLQNGYTGQQKLCLIYLISLNELL